ncbi:hypothetical protein IQ249_19050 [Lusitaniella coriacea LEGE 07157]|uniref:DUF1772 domain-containing protein n=1 Tax=Lusitaniella coriacea LEGE 07157 TaxID=945747 RepID=A0A8J7JCZ6_9CYAN|nr:hypothetical protein [Lusitaniella coriacea]MBE9118000.1 hypothetical protein [Lusitaniella coriacea LEGE 07157]
MSLETIALIGVLTLLAISVGADFLWLIVMKPALSQISDRAALEIMGSIHLQAIKVMPVIFLIMLTFAVILNLIPPSRSESYLLRIGLISLAIYFALVLVTSISIHHGSVSISNGAESELMIRELQNKWDAILWFRAIGVLVSYWSFLHYALNPKIHRT